MVGFPISADSLHSTCMGGRAIIIYHSIIYIYMHIYIYVCVPHISLYVIIKNHLQSDI